MKILMKSSLVLLTLTLTAMIAEATPAIGDKATFAVDLTKGSQALQGKVTFELTAYDQATETWTQVSTTEVSGQTQVQQDKVASKDLLTDASIDAMLADCAKANGKAETVTVPAGTFPACAVPITTSDSTGTAWVSKVPFGYSKWTATRNDGMVINGVLESYKAGPVVP